MNKLIDERLSVIVSLALGTGAGWSLSSYIHAVEIKQWLTSIAIAFSLMVSLIVSAYYKSNRRRLSRSKFWRYSVISIAMFVVLLITFFLTYTTLETNLYVNSTSIDQKTRTTDSIFIKGLYYTTTAKNAIKAIKKNDPNGDVDIRVLFSDSNNDINTVWDKDSRTLAKLIILLCYIFFIASFVIAITITTEILKEDKSATDKSQKNKKTYKRPGRTRKLE